MLEKKFDGLLAICGRTAAWEFFPHLMICQPLALPHTLELCHFRNVWGNVVRTSMAPVVTYLFLGHLGMCHRKQLHQARMVHPTARPAAAFSVRWTQDQRRAVRLKTRPSNTSQIVGSRSWAYAVNMARVHAQPQNTNHEVDRGAGCSGTSVSCRGWQHVPGPGGFRCSRVHLHLPTTTIWVS